MFYTFILFYFSNCIFSSFILIFLVIFYTLQLRSIIRDRFLRDFLFLTPDSIVDGDPLYFFVSLLKKFQRNITTKDNTVIPTANFINDKNNSASRFFIFIITLYFFIKVIYFLPFYIYNL